MSLAPLWDPFPCEIQVCLWYRRVSHLPVVDLKAGAWWAVYWVVLGGMSYVGSFGSGRNGIPFPLDSVVVVVVVLAITFYY